MTWFRFIAHTFWQKSIEYFFHHRTRNLILLYQFHTSVKKTSNSHSFFIYGYFIDAYKVEIFDYIAMNELFNIKFMKKQINFSKCWIIFSRIAKWFNLDKRHSIFMFNKEKLFFSRYKLKLLLSFFSL